MISLLALRIGGPSVLSSLAENLQAYSTTEAELEKHSNSLFKNSADSIKDLAQNSSWR